MSDTPELTRDATARFTGRTGDYVKYRPSYPKEAIDAIFRGLGDASKLTVADVGAGTGIATRLLLERGANVVAIEPNEDMRSAAEAAGLTARAARAESTGLSDGSCDVVAMFQAFHWVEAPAALREFKRILRPGGRIALVWNIRDDRDAFTRGYGDIFDRQRECEIAKTFAFDWHGIENTLSAAGLQGITKQTFRYEQLLDRDGLLGRARSASYVPLEGPQRDAILARLSELHMKFAGAGGVVPLVYHTDVYLAHT